MRERKVSKRAKVGEIAEQSKVPRHIQCPTCGIGTLESGAGEEVCSHCGWRPKSGKGERPRGRGEDEPRDSLNRREAARPLDGTYDIVRRKYREGWRVDKIARFLNRTTGEIAGIIFDLGEAGIIKPQDYGIDRRS